MKLQDIDILVGQTIVSYKWEQYVVELTCASGKRYEVLVEDDGDGGNDSHAWFDSAVLGSILNKPISRAWHEDESSYGVILNLETEDGSKGYIQIIHEHNGYYGFSYDVKEVA